MNSQKLYKFNRVQFVKSKLIFIGFLSLILGISIYQKWFIGFTIFFGLIIFTSILKAVGMILIPKKGEFDLYCQEEGILIGGDNFIKWQYIKIKFNIFIIYHLGKTRGFPFRFYPPEMKRIFEKNIQKAEAEVD